MSERSCKTCEHWDTESVDAEAYGLCRCNPPTVVIEAGVPFTYFPTVKNSDYCDRRIPIPQQGGGGD